MGLVAEAAGGGDFREGQLGLGQEFLGTPQPLGHQPPVRGFADLQTWQSHPEFYTLVFQCLG